MRISVRYVAYTLVTVIPALVGVFVGIEIGNPALGFSLACIYAILGVILGILHEIRISMKEQVETIPVEVIIGEEELKKKYKELRDEIGCITVKAIWCAHYPETSKYFNDERKALAKNRKLNIQRLVNPETIGERDFLLFQKFSEKLAKSAEGRYNYKITDISAFECLFTVYERYGRTERKALFVINDREECRPELGILLDSTKHKELGFAVMAIEDWFDFEWRRASEQNSWEADKNRPKRGE